MISTKPHRFSCKMGITVFLCVILAGCGIFSIPPVPTPTDSITPQPIGMVKFVATLPADTNPSDPVYLNILDEVTGFVYKFDRYELNRVDAHTATTSLPFPIQALIKYRYSIGKDQQVTERNARNEPVLYRPYLVNGNDEIKDQIFSWKSVTPSDIPTGRVSGQFDIKTISSTLPPDLWVCAAGICSTANADGSFYLTGIQPGQHNLVVLSPQGQTKPVQQNVVVQAGANTSVNLALSPIQLMDVTFTVSSSEVVQSGLPIRMVGNISPLGYVAYDDDTSTSIYPMRAPELTRLSASTYGITLKLPVGFDLKYKYTLGDGFWNSELSLNGDIMTRGLIVPDHPIEIKDEIHTWLPNSSKPIHFRVTVPDNTPSTDQISVQFNIYGWRTPLPMVKTADGTWEYTLYNPLLNSTDFSYRYCRNDQCESLNNLKLSGGKDQSIISTKDHIDTVQSWSWWNPQPTPQTVVMPDIQKRPVGFIFGAGMVTNKMTMAQPYLNQSMVDMSQTGFRYVVIHPESRPISALSPEMEIASSISQEDIVSLAGLAKINGLELILYPSIQFPDGSDAWWKSNQRDFAWWQTWFDQYSRFVLSQADLAQSLGVKALVLGGSWLTPALPGGLLADGSSSNVPPDAEARWSSLIKSLRTHYQGKIFWAISYPFLSSQIPSFISSFDTIYLEIRFSKAAAANSLPLDGLEKFQLDLDGTISDLQMDSVKNIIFSISYPSIQNKADVPASAEEIFTNLSSETRQDNNWTDQKIQLDGYNSVLSALNAYDWVGGIVCDGYFAPAKAQDPTASVHGKWAETLLNYWFTKMKTD